MIRTLLSRVLTLVFAACGAGGCAAFTNPVSEGIPVRRLPDQVFAEPKSELKDVPLNLLRINDPGDYKLDKGDVLGVLADEILTKENQPVPIQFSQNPNALKPAVQGVPVPVQDDGTILLPLLDPINVKGKTLIEARNLIVDQMVNKKQIVVKGKERVLVDLLQPRRYRVLVVREDNGNAPLVSAGNYASTVSFGGGRKGAAYSLLMEPGRNDLLQALTQTGGPPGFDAKHEIVIRRGKYDPADPLKGFVRVPTRARPDQPLTFTEADITLEDGDTVNIEARDTEVFYTAGLLPASIIPVPRDRDLRVIEAIAAVRGPLINGGFNQNQFTATSVNVGVGNPNPSLVTVIRRLPNGQQIPIRVDLNVAFRDLRENIIIQPGDTVVLQERPGEALTRYFTQTFRLGTTVRVVTGDRFNSTGVSSNP
ncbi:MAG: polysaccharide biosynthesis/export family protein [Planctomycetes bacterium]|nr:polysaccharide biosynthesis/export family protein [Planctomycetota bacterium]